MHLRVAGFTIGLTSADRDLNLSPGTAARRFVVEPAPPDVLIEVVTRERADDDVARECLFDSGGPWRLYRHDDGFLFRFFSATLNDIPYKTAIFNHDFSKGRICLHREFSAGRPTVDPLEYPLDELLVISLLGQGRGVELHGCGVVDGTSAGYVFVGQSGAGKSTMARLWLTQSGAEILSDDRVVVRDEPDGFWMYGTPWHGEEPLASPRRARLDALFLLRQYESDAIAPVQRASAVARLFAASFPPFHSASALSFTLGCLDRLVEHVPCFELRFAPTPAVLDIIRARGR